MKKINGLRKLLALILTVVMAGGMISAYAEEQIYADDYYGNLHVDVDDDSTDNMYEIIVDGNLKGNLTVNVDVSAYEKEAYVTVFKETSGDVAVTAKGSGHACADLHGDVGKDVTITAENGAKAELVQPYENIETFDKSDIAGSATLEASGGGWANLTTGDVKEITATATGTKEDNPDRASAVDVTAQDTGAIVSNAASGGKVDITVEDVKVTKENADATGISVNQDVDPSAAVQGTNTVKADSVSVTTTGDNKYAFGLLIDDGTVIIGTDESTDGTNAGTGTTGTDEKKDTNGDVMAKAENGWAKGVVAQGKTDVTVYGDVSVEAGKEARGVFAASGKSARVMVEGSVTVKSDGSAYGADVCSEGSSTTVYAQNGISASGAYANAISTTTHSNGDSSVFVQGDVKAESATGYADAVVISCQGGNTTINVDGNVTGDGIDNGTAAGYGIFANYITSGSSAQVEINGILSGTAAAILINDEKDAINTTKADISVWAAEENTDRNIAVSFSGVTNNQTKALEDSIHYIIRIADAFKGILTNDAVTPESSTKTVTFGEGEDQKVYKTANKGEKVTIDTSGITLSENEVLEGVYYYYDKPEENEDAVTSDVITENTNGIYTLTMGMSTILDNVRGMMQLGLKTHTHDFSKCVGREKEPTCTETGIDRYQCTGCDATITETLAANPDNHTLANGEAKAVTCTEDGWEAYQYCTQCDYSTKVVIPAGHDFSVDVPAKAASCTEDGYTAHKECSRCHEKNSDYQVIKAKDHEFEEQLTADKKTHWYACKNCDAKKDEANHIPGTTVKENEQLAKNGAVKSYEEVTYCTVCGAELSRETVIVPPPKDDTKGNPNAGEDDVTEFKPVIQNEINLSSIPMPEDVSSDDDDVVLEKLANCPDALKETAKQELAALKRSGYKIDCGCVAWSKSGKTAACTLKLSEKDVPDGAQIFVNGAAVQAERKDGYYYFEITLPAVVVVAHK